MKEKIRKGLTGFLTATVLSLGGCATLGSSSLNSSSPTGNYISQENFLPIYSNIANSPLNEREKERAYEQLLTDFRASVNEQTIRPYERDWLRNPLTRTQYPQYIQQRMTDEDKEWFKGLVDFNHLSLEDLIFLLRYDNACDK